MPHALDLLDGGRILAMRFDGAVHTTDAGRFFERTLDMLNRGDVLGIVIDSSLAEVKDNPAWIRGASEDFFTTLGNSRPVVYVGPASGWPIERAAMLRCIAMEFDFDFEVTTDFEAGLDWLRSQIARNAAINPGRDAA
jgi:hypothetical protein